MLHYLAFHLRCVTTCALYNSSAVRDHVGSSNILNDKGLPVSRVKVLSFLPISPAATLTSGIRSGNENNYCAHHRLTCVSSKINPGLMLSLGTTEWENIPPTLPQQQYCLFKYRYTTSVQQTCNLVTFNS